MIVLRELWRVTKVRETTIILNKIIYRKKCLGITPVRNNLTITTSFFEKDVKKKKKAKTA